MGLLQKLTGGPDKKLLETGLLGRGIITEVRPTGTTFQSVYIKLGMTSRDQLAAAIRHT